MSIVFKVALVCSEINQESLVTLRKDFCRPVAARLGPNGVGRYWGKTKE